MADIAIAMFVEFDSIKFHNERPVVVVVELLVLGPLRSQGEVVLLAFAGVVAPVEKHCGCGLAPW